MIQCITQAAQKTLVLLSAHRADGYKEIKLKNFHDVTKINLP